MLTTTGTHKKRRLQYEAMRDKMSTRPTDGISSECFVHMERTLDETYFPGLPASELALRNADQVVSSSVEDEREASKPILVVPQLWIWQFPKCVVVAHGMPRREDGWVLEDFDTTFGTHRLWRYGITPSRHDDCAQYMIIRIILRYVESFGREGLDSNPPLEQFDLKGLMGRRAPPEVDLPSRKIPPTLDLFERRVVGILSNVKEYMRHTKRNRINFKEEERFHHAISDCRSELAMIKHILKQQKMVLDDFRQDVSRDIEDLRSRARTRESTWKGSSVSEERQKFVIRLNGLTDSVRLIDSTCVILEKYQERIQKIDEDADRIEKNVQDLLNLKRTYASVQDSHASVLLGVAAGAFAVVTIFFAPLAFLTALFALKVQGFDRLMIVNAAVRETSEESAGTPGAEPVYSSGKMTGIFSELDTRHNSHMPRETNRLVVGSVLLTFIVTGLMVFCAMKWLHIDLSDLRFESSPTPDPETKKSRVKKKKDTQDDNAKAKVSGGVVREASKEYPRVSKATGAASGGTNVRKRASREIDVEAQI